jgi:pantetheine-phosphate adenylyltransferase
VVGVFVSPPKHTLFAPQERAEMMGRALSHLPNVKVEVYHGLTVEFAKHIGARVIVRGLRMGSDFEREFEMGLMNKKLAPDVETVCLITKVEYQFLSSSLLKEIMSAGGCIDGLVPEVVADALRKKFKKEAIESGI